MWRHACLSCTLRVMKLRAGPCVGCATGRACSHVLHTLRAFNFKLVWFALARAHTHTHTHTHTNTHTHTQAWEWAAFCDEDRARYVNIGAVRHVPAVSAHAKHMHHAAHEEFTESFCSPSPRCLLSAHPILSTCWTTSKTKNTHIHTNAHTKPSCCAARVRIIESAMPALRCRV
jgi:hypothetical protein